MIQHETRLTVADNSGAREVLCIGTGRKNGRVTVGDVITIAVKKVYPTTPMGLKNKAKKGEVHKALVVSRKYPILRSSGERLSFGESRVVLLKPDKVQLFGTRITHAVSKGVSSKILSLAPHIY